jgi:NAD(P)-dependent dehydrogenase (short-subunit alcohol dehydrogenase family)
LQHIILPFAKKEIGERLDVLVNNAGMGWASPDQALTEQGFEALFGVMHLAHYLLTRLLLPLLLNTPGTFPLLSYLSSLSFFINRKQNHHSIEPGPHLRHS